VKPSKRVIMSQMAAVLKLLCFSKFDFKWVERANIQMAIGAAFQILQQSQKGLKIRYLSKSNLSL
jgi:hypothetical protein